MHDTLGYLASDPVHRKYRHEALTFTIHYAFSENFVLPLSHDEVVHGKGSLLARMPGDDWQRFANLRLLYCHQYTMPGRKLLFMGSELAAPEEWNFRAELNWDLLSDHRHAGVQRLVDDLNDLIREIPALHALDFESDGFQWLDCHDSSQSVIAFLRKGSHSIREHVVCVLNFTPVQRMGYRLGVPTAGTYVEILNSDADVYGGSGLGNAGAALTEAVPWMGWEQSLNLTLPPLGALILSPSAPGAS
jgi:1,4-alpha-glucan branching enzyme